MKNTILLLLFIACLLPGAKTSAAQTLNGVSNASYASAPFSRDDKQGNNLKVKSRKQAMAIVKKQYQAKILSVESSKGSARVGYRVKLLTNSGTVFYVFVDATTGRVSRS